VRKREKERTGTIRDPITPLSVLTRLPSLTRGVCLHKFNMLHSPGGQSCLDSDVQQTRWASSSKVHVIGGATTRANNVELSAIQREHHTAYAHHACEH